MKPLKIFIIIITLGFTSLAFSQDVFTTKTGEKYHKESCRYLSKSKYRVDLKDAIQYGYDPCSVCKPPAKASNSSSNTSNYTRSNTTNTSSNTSSSSATQCTGKTKAGNRCKRTTKSASGRCYQH